MGEHRMARGKQTSYTTYSSFPLIVTEPGVRKGETRPGVVLNTDLAPTFAAWGRTSAASADGRSFAPLLGNPDAPWREAGLVEGAASKRSASKRSPITPGNPAYEAVRTEDGNSTTQGSTRTSSTTSRALGPKRRPTCAPVCRL
jgi:N-acetylglucosamine-6-sulfatase